MPNQYTGPQITEKQAKAIEYAKLGLSQKKSLRMAGYSNSTVMSRNRGPINQYLADAKGQFAKDCLKRAKAIGYNGKYMVDRWKEISDKRGNVREDFNAIMATREMTKLIMQTTPANSTNINLNGIFVVPNRNQPDKWDQSIPAENVDQSKQYLVDNSVDNLDKPEKPNE